MKHKSRRQGRPALSTSPWAVQFAGPGPTINATAARKAGDLESMAKLIEDLIPKLQKEEERQFYREVVRSYRAAAQDVRSWSDDRESSKNWFPRNTDDPSG